MQWLRTFDSNLCLFPVGSVVSGAGAFEVAVSAALSEFKKTVKGRARLGVQVTFSVICINYVS